MNFRKIKEFIWLKKNSLADYLLDSYIFLLLRKMNVLDVFVILDLKKNNFVSRSTKIWIELNFRLIMYVHAIHP